MLANATHLAVRAGGMSRSSYGSLDAWDWERLPISAPAALLRWWSMLRDETPWRAMRRDDQLGEMRRVVAELLNEARDPDDGMRPHRLVMSARTHGRYRRGQHCNECDLLHEICVLRRAIASLLLEAGWSHRSVSESLIVLDSDLAAVRDGVRRGVRRDVGGVAR